MAEELKIDQATALEMLSHLEDKLHSFAQIFKAQAQDNLSLRSEIEALKFEVQSLRRELQLKDQHISQLLQERKEIRRRIERLVAEISSIVG